MPQDARKHLVIKANDLIQKSRFSLTLQQQKIVLYLISQIHPNDTELLVYLVPVVKITQHSKMILKQ